MCNLISRSVYCFFLIFLYFTEIISKNVYIQTTPFINSNISNSMHIIGNIAGSKFGLCKSFKLPFNFYHHVENKTYSIFNKKKKFKVMPSIGYVNNRLTFALVPAFVSKYKIPNNTLIYDAFGNEISLISKTQEIECASSSFRSIKNFFESTLIIKNTTTIRTVYIYTIACYTEHISGEYYIFNNSLHQLNIAYNEEPTFETIILRQHNEQPSSKLKYPLFYGINVTIYRGYNYNYNINGPNNIYNRVTIVGFDEENKAHSVVEYYIKTLLLQKNLFNCYNKIYFTK